MKASRLLLSLLCRSSSSAHQSSKAGSWRSSLRWEWAACWPCASPERTRNERLTTTTTTRRGIVFLLSVSFILCDHLSTRLLSLPLFFSSGTGLVLFEKANVCSNFDSFLSIPLSLLSLLTPRTIFAFSAIRSKARKKRQAKERNALQRDIHLVDHRHRHRPSGA